MQSPQPRVGFVFFMATGLMLFALFFGAGNLIFPALMGQQAGDMSVPAVLGFVFTGAGLPLLGVVAMAYSGERDVQALAGGCRRCLVWALPCCCIYQSALCLVCRAPPRWRLKWVCCLYCPRGSISRRWQCLACCFSAWLFGWRCRRLS